MIKISPFTFPLILHTLGVLFFIILLPQFRDQGVLTDNAWMVLAPSATIQAIAILWMAISYKRHSENYSKGRYFFFFILQNLGLWPVVILLFVFMYR